MKTLMILGNFEEGALEIFFNNGFAKQNYKVLNYEITKDYFKAIKSTRNKIINYIYPNLLLININKKLLVECKRIKPDIIFVCKGLTLFPETIEELKKYCSLLVNYNPDHPLIFFSRGSGNTNIYDSIKFYDLYFTYSKSIAKNLNDLKKIDTYVIPFGYDPMPINTLNQKNKNNNKFLFFGAWDKSREFELAKLNWNDIEIFGDKNWERSKINANVLKSYQGRKLFGAELQQKIRQYTGTINLLRKQNIIENSHNMRTFEVPGAGGLLVSQYTDEQAFFFEPDKEAIYFNSSEELKEKMKYLMKDEKLVKKIKMEALNRSINSNYSYDHRCLEMSRIIKQYI